MADNQYEIPAYGLPAPTILNWCLSAQQEGEGWLKAQRPALQWEAAMSALSGEGSTSASIEGLSNLGYEKVKRIARELVASLSNFRHEGEIKPVWDQTLFDTANTLTNLDRHWYRTTYANDAHRAALQYAVATGTAYLYETWDKHYHSAYRGDIRLEAIAPQNVTFVQLPADHDIQRAYATIIRREMPLNLAKAIYGEINPAFAAQLVPDRDSPSYGWVQKGLQAVQKFLAPALRVAGRSPNQQAQASFPTVDIFEMYVNDRSVNDSGTPKQMGALGTNWAYTVPSLGDPIPTDTINPETGNHFTIPATHDHCRLFPLRRFVVFSRTALGYDGSSPWWHGETPLARIRFTDWAWEALGQSQIADLKTMQDGIVALMRGIEDSAAARLDPPMLYDDTLVSRTWSEAFNARKAGARAAAPLMSGKPIEYPVDPHYYDVPPWVTDWIQQQEARMDYLAATTDLVAIAKAKQVPGADTLEKLMEMAGPIVQDLVRQIEHPLQKLGDWRIAYLFQYYTKQRMLTITGPEGVDIDIQYKPEQLAMIQPRETNEQFTTRKRGMIHDFRYHVTESGINEIHRMTTKLLFAQLIKLGIPIDWWTMARVCQLPNFGPEPVGTNNMMERWIAQQHIMADLQVDLAARQAQKAAAAGIMPGAPAEGSPEGNGNQPPSGGAGGPEGRPPSFNAPPRMESKDGGSRTTISTSR